MAERKENKTFFYGSLVAIVAVVVIVLLTTTTNLAGAVIKKMESVPLKQTCIDPDGGKNFRKASSFVGLTERGGYTRVTDSCVGPDRIIEWYCNGNYVLSTDFEKTRYAAKGEPCPKGTKCIAGACQ